MKCTANPPPGDLCHLCGLVHIPLIRQPRTWIIAGVIVVVGIILYSLYRSQIARNAWALLSNDETAFIERACDIAEDAIIRKTFPVWPSNWSRAQTTDAHNIWVDMLSDQ